ncbi:LysR family transcriptional regulator [Intrasporangium calvum]|uniref:Transcriptional regulator, LysR family n=1 Tax=Intrasporangium calvum (strain ATCC 23552 / DSM 43043 / JCM 3097 / NBRC 12989 / NCIMB 10167 / NRRL B-3866 / 7 KIP) TaxID=710696 RepID=E6SCV6_INTC7|nr:LysR family transcriptional regulator [Intrasporangium calvum]ADU47511.1 transcriptional regulator, LysR family [Intrasporangium calvum DSM 43043]AXG12714.1 LysR family transcriptional regulator [Intrasporangium calvum]
MLDTHRIRVFRSVMASGSIQAAADNLGYTPSAISQQISALQKETGLTLFEREGRGLSPTAAARSLVAHTNDLMGELSKLDSVVTDLREGRSGRLTIGYFTSAGAEWMPTLARRLSAEMPDLTLELVLNEIPRRGGAPFDLNILVEVAGAQDPHGSRRIPLAVDPYVALLPGDHPLADSSAVTLADLEGDTWISNDLPQAICSKILAASCEAAGFRPRFAVQAQDHYTAIAFVRAGVGITVIPGLAAHLPTSDPQVRVVPIAPPQPIRHIAAVVRDPAGNKAANRAVELLLELIG